MAITAPNDSFTDLTSISQRSSLQYSVGGLGVFRYRPPGYCRSGSGFVFLHLIMEPASAILGIASGAATLVAMIGQTVSYLVDLCDSYRNARLVILDLMTNLQAFQVSLDKH